MLSILHWRCLIRDLRADRYLAIHAFNTPLEMRGRSLKTSQTCMTTPFNTPLEMPGKVKTHAGSAGTSALSILHWRCELEKDPDTRVAVDMVFQYSIGDAGGVAAFAVGAAILLVAFNTPLEMLMSGAQTIMVA